MSRRTIRSSTATALALIAIGATALADSRRAEASPPDRSEVLIGYYHCGADASGGYQWIEFTSTGDIFSDRTYLQQPIAAGIDPVERCAPLTNVVNESLAASACSIGSVQVYRDETGESRSFSFACHGPRSRLISLIAALGQLILSP